MRKITSLLMLLCMYVATAWADVTIPYSAGKWESFWKSTDGLTLDERIVHTNCGSTLYYNSTEVVVSEAGDVKVTVDYTGGSHKIVILAIELLAGDGTVSYSDYHVGESGGSDNDNVYTLAEVAAGEYSMRIYVCHKAGDHALNNTSGNIICVGNITEKVIEPEPLTTTKYYKIKNVGRSGPNMLAADAEKAKSTPANKVTEAEMLWALEEAGDGQYKFRNARWNNYLGHTTKGNTAWPMVADKDAATSFYVKVHSKASSNRPDPYYVFGYEENGEKTWAHDADWGEGYNYEQVVGWEAAAEASQWIFVKTDIPVDAQEVTFTYSFKYNGVEKGTQTCTGLVGEAYPNLDIPYGVAANKPTGELTAEINGTTVDVVVTYNLPFVAAADYASIKNWYYIQMHSSGGNYSRYIQAMDGYIEWLDVDMNASEADSYTWGFIGNPFDGFKLVNYANGNTKSVNANASANPVIEPAMGDIATATAWTLKPSASNPTAEYFCFQYPGSNQYVNAQSGKIAFWGSADEGSTMWVTERDLSGATELQAVIDQVEAFVAAGVTGGTTVGYLTGESVANVATVLAAAKEAVATKTGCIAAQVALQAAVAAVKTIQPEEGKFYVIASAMPESDSRAGQKMYVNNDGYMHFQAADAFANVFQFVNKEGKFYLLNVQSGAYLNTAKGHNGGQETTLAFDIADAKSVAIANMGRANAVSLIPEGGAMMHAQTSGSSVVAWDNTDNAGASAWVITEVNIEDFAHTVTVGEVRYSTLVLGYNAVIPANVKAYAVSTVEDGRAKLAEVTGVLAAGEAVVLEAAEGSYDFKYATEAATEVESNLLAGTVFNTNVAANAYVLANGEDGIGLYKATLNKDANGGEGDTHFLNNANKAYLPASAVPAGARFLSFDFGTETAIDELKGENGNVKTVIYDLSGRRVQKAQKGLYIVNGVKVIK